FSYPHRSGRGKLRDHRWADQHRILDLVNRFEQMFGDNHISDAPARKAVGLGEGKERDRMRITVSDRPRRKVPLIAIGEILVGLIADVIDTGFAADLIYFAESGFGIDGAGGIVR